MTIRSSTLIRLLAVVAAMVVAGLAWRLMQRAPGDEERIATMLEEMREGAEARDPSQILDHVAATFRDADGMGRKELRAYLLGYFLGAQSISATFLSRKIDVRQDAATVEMRVLLRRDRAGEPRRISLRLGREGDEWKIQAARHEPLLGGP